jgi:hypothetical protein
MNDTPNIEVLSNLSRSVMRKYPTLPVNLNKTKNLNALYEHDPKAECASKTIAALIILKSWRQHKER